MFPAPNRAGRNSSGDVLNQAGDGTWPLQTSSLRLADCLRSHRRGGCVPAARLCAPSSAVGFRGAMITGLELSLLSSVQQRHQLAIARLLNLAFRPRFQSLSRLIGISYTAGIDQRGGNLLFAHAVVNNGLLV